MVCVWCVAWHGALGFLVVMCFFALTQWVHDGKMTQKSIHKQADDLLFSHIHGAVRALWLLSWYNILHKKSIVLVACIGDE